MTDSVPALHRAEGHGKLGELVHRLKERAGPGGALTEHEFRAELPPGFDAQLQDQIRTRLAVLGVSIVAAGRHADGDDEAVPVIVTPNGATAESAAPIVPAADANAGVAPVPAGGEVLELAVIARQSRRVSIERPPEGRITSTSDPVRM
jgi:hypothetical protein